MKGDVTMSVKFNFKQMVSISDLQRKLGEISEKVSEEDVLVLKNNKPEFILVAPDKYENLINAYEVLEQLEVYKTIQDRQKKPSLNSKQMLHLLESIEEEVHSANDSKDRSNP